MATSSGSRPAAANRLPDSGRSERLGWVETKITSPQRAAKALPRADWPAWMITGWPCGERGTVNGPRERKYGPT